MSRLSQIVSSIFLIQTLIIPAFAQDAVQRTLSQIDWKTANLAREEASKTAENVIKNFHASSPEGLDGVKLPVLIFGTDGDWGLPRFRGQGTAYGVVYKPERAKLSILGSSSKIIAPKGLKFEHDGVAFESIGDGADYSFTRYGASYTLRLTCDEPLKDKRCTDPQYLTDAAKTLIVVGGRP